MLPISSRPAERRRRADTVGRSSRVARDRGHGLHVIDASIMPTVVRAKVTVPALYVASDRDLVVKFPGAQQAPANLTNTVPRLRKHIVLPGCGRWTQQERATDVNAEMVEFLKSL